MKAWQKQNMKTWHEQDRAALEAEGYDIRELTPFHYRVTAGFAEDVVVDVWPTSRKMMQLGAEYAEKYDDIVNSIAEIFFDRV